MKTKEKNYNNLADDLRAGDKNAYRLLKAIFVYYLRNHTPLRRISDADEDLYRDFVVMLIANQTKLSSRYKPSLGAYLTEIKRFINDRERYSITEGSSPEWKHFYKKVKSILVENSDFEALSKATYAGRKRYRLASKPSDIKGLTDEEMFESLPLIKSVLKSTRDDQLPEIAKRDDLFKSIKEIFVLSNNKERSVEEIAKILWQRLEPSPPEAVYINSLDIPANGAIDKTVDLISDPQESKVSTMMFARYQTFSEKFLNSLSERTRRVAFYRYNEYLVANKERPLEEIARLLEVSRGTVDNEVKRFQELFKTFCESEGISEENEIVFFVELVLEKLSSGSFYK